MKPTMINYYWNFHKVMKSHLMQARFFQSLSIVVENFIIGKLGVNLNLFSSTKQTWKNHKFHKI